MDFRNYSKLSCGLGYALGVCRPKFRGRELILGFNYDVKFPDGNKLFGVCINEIVDSSSGTVEAEFSRKLVILTPEGEVPLLDGTRMRVNLNATAVRQEREGLERKELREKYLEQTVLETRIKELRNSLENHFGMSVEEYFNLSRNG